MQGAQHRSIDGFEWNNIWEDQTGVAHKRPGDLPHYVSGVSTNILFKGKPGKPCLEKMF